MIKRQDRAIFRCRGYMAVSWWEYLPPFNNEGQIRGFEDSYWDVV